MKLVNSFQFPGEEGINIFEAESRNGKSTASRIAVVYGANGSGKTTLGKKLLYSRDSGIKWGLISENGEVEIREDIEVKLFNEDFITTQLRFKDDGSEVEGLQAVVLFGAQVEQEEDLERLTEDLNLAENQLESLENERNSLDGKKGRILECKNIVKNELKNTKWHDYVAKARGIKTARVGDGELSRLKALVSKQLPSVEDLTNRLNQTLEAVERGSGSEKVNVYPTELAHPTSLDEWTDMFKQTPKIDTQNNEVLKYIEGQKKVGGVEALQVARSAFLERNEETCPTCLRDLNKAERTILKEALQLVYEDVARDDLKKSLKQLPSLVKLEPATNIFLTCDKIGFSKSEFDRVYRDLVDEIEIVETHRKEKLESPEAVIVWNSDPLLQAIDSYNDKVQIIRDEIDKFNSDIDEFNRNKDLLQSLADQLAFLHPAVAKSVKDLFQCQQRLNDLEKSLLIDARSRVQSLRSEIDELNAKKGDFSLSVDVMNQFLTSVFAEKGRLKVCYAERRKGFEIYSKNRLVRCADLSTGERNIIALAYYFTSCIERCSIDNLYSSKFLFVLDDPLSSFDSDNKYGVLVLLRQILSRFIQHSESQFIILTHDIGVAQDFSSVISLIPNARASFLEISSGKVVGRPIGKINAYSAILRKIYTFSMLEDVEDSSLGVDEVLMPTGNEMRQFLESFAEFHFGVGISDLPQLKVAKKAFEESSADLSEYLAAPMYKLLLHGESHTSDLVRAGNFDTGPLFGPKERQTICRELLCLIHVIAPWHLQSRLSLNPSGSEYSNLVCSLVDWGAAVENRNLSF